MGLHCMAPNAPDMKQNYTSAFVLAKIVPFLTYSAEYYVAALEVDCDDYAKWAAADASRIFNINAVYQCWGTMPLGYHAFNLAIVGDRKYKLWDANAGFPYAGELFDEGQHGYRSEKWK